MLKYFFLWISVLLVFVVFLGLKQRKIKKGVYLSQEQIHNLENKKELPVVNVPMFLNYGETAVWYSFAIRRDLKKEYPGKFIITNERIVFLNDLKGFELNHNKITALTTYKEGFGFQSGNRNYLVEIPYVDLAEIAFECVRFGGIPCSVDNTIIDPVSGELQDSEFDFDDIEENEIIYVDGMEGHDFEYYCADLLRKNGFTDVSVTQGSGDQGVDILATKYGIKYAIQCKNYASALSNKPIQEVNAGKTFYNCHVGVVLTNSTFTPGAKALAEATGVLLWDRETLHSMINSMEEK